MMVKKQYTSPEVKAYGTVQEITMATTLKKFGMPGDGLTYEQKPLHTCSEC